jgi:hypothetical protein
VNYVRSDTAQQRAGGPELLRSGARLRVPAGQQRQVHLLLGYIESFIGNHDSLPEYIERFLAGVRQGTPLSAEGAEALIRAAATLMA